VPSPRIARATRKTQDRRASQEFPEAKRLLGAAANSRGHRHEENLARLVQVAKALPLQVGAALLASAEGYTPRGNAVLDRAREELGSIPELANALADNLPAPKAPVRKSRRRRKKRKAGAAAQAAPDGAVPEQGAAEAPAPEPAAVDDSAARPDAQSDGARARRRRRRPRVAADAGGGTETPAEAPVPPAEDAA
jgi:hypothetical protein